MDFFMPVLSRFGFLTCSLSFANLLSPFSVLVIPEGEDNFTNILGLIFCGLVREDFIGKGFIFPGCIGYTSTHLTALFLGDPDSREI